MSSPATPFPAPLPEPPYYAVIFPSARTDGDRGYAAVAGRMVELAREMPGFLGLESARNPDGTGLTVSYWRSEEDIRRWHAVAEHQRAQQAGKDVWYGRWAVRVARVDRSYGGGAET